MLLHHDIETHIGLPEVRWIWIGDPNRRMYKLFWFPASCQMQDVRIGVTVAILHPALSWLISSTEPFWPIPFQPCGLSLEGELEGLYNTGVWWFLCAWPHCSFSASKTEIAGTHKNLSVKLSVLQTHLQWLWRDCSAVFLNNKGKEIRSPNNLALAAWQSDLHVALLHGTI